MCTVRNYCRPSRTLLEWRNGAAYCHLFLPRQYYTPVCYHATSDVICRYSNHDIMSDVMTFNAAATSALWPEFHCDWYTPTAEDQHLCDHQGRNDSAFHHIWRHFDVTMLSYLQVVYTDIITSSLFAELDIQSGPRTVGPISHVISVYHFSSIEILKILPRLYSTAHIFCAVRSLKSPRNQTL